MGMTPELLDSYLKVIIGAIGAIISILISLKATGRIVYPVEKIEAGKAKIRALVESNEALGEVAGLVENISIDELNNIIAKRQELDITETSVEKKALILGTMLLEATESKEQ